MWLRNSDGRAGYFLVEVALALALFAAAAVAYLPMALAAAQSTATAAQMNYLNGLVDNLEEAVRAAPLTFRGPAAGRPGFAGGPAAGILAVAEEAGTWGEREVALRHPGTGAEYVVTARFQWNAPERVEGIMSRVTLRVAVECGVARVPGMKAAVAAVPAQVLRLERIVNRTF